MAADPFFGVLYHWTGGLAAASFYLPFRGIKKWGWETGWLVGGFFSWIIAPHVMAWLLVPGFAEAIHSASNRTLFWTYFFGLLWGIGGLTFGLTVRYLGIALGYAMALGLCALGGTIIPPIFDGTFTGMLYERSGQVILAGLAVCLVGIGVGGVAGSMKERELTTEQKRATTAEFSLTKGLIIAVICGIMSACMTFGIIAGEPIKLAARKILVDQGRSDIWQGLPTLVVVLLGGFTTNFVWCVILNMKNRSGRQYISRRVPPEPIGAHEPATATAFPVDVDPASPRGGTGPAPALVRVPLLANYFCAALAGTIWYFQFFFYTMGQTKMGPYDFSSWTLHMASIIIFSTLWGVALKEWKGTSSKTHAFIATGLALLVASTLIVGYGNYLKSLVH